MAAKDHPTIETTLVSYGIDISTPEGRTMYDELMAECRTLTGLQTPNWRVNMDFPVRDRHATAAYNYHDRLSGKPGIRGVIRRTVRVSLGMINDDQWSIYVPEDDFTGALSAHDWAVFKYANNSLVFGCALHINDELKYARTNTYKCGYCGFMAPAQKGYTFCPNCLGSAYLGEKDLHLTRMQPAGSREPRAPLTEAERGNLLPQYVQAQTIAKADRDAKARVTEREAVLKRYDDLVSKATAERDGRLWFLDREVATDNLIYYDHTKRFSFGWRNPVSEAVRDRLLEIVSEFPYLYEIKCSDGKTYSN